MTGELEDTEYSHKPDHTENSQTHGLVGGLVLRRNRSTGQVQRVLFFSDDGGESNEVRDDRNYIYDVHHVSEEVKLVWTC